MGSIRHTTTNAQWRALYADMLHYKQKAKELQAENESLACDVSRMIDELAELHTKHDERAELFANYTPIDVKLLVPL